MKVEYHEGLNKKINVLKGIIKFTHLELFTNSWLLTTRHFLNTKGMRLLPSITASIVLLVSGHARSEGEVDFDGCMKEVSSLVENADGFSGAGFAIDSGAGGVSGGVVQAAGQGDLFSTESGQAMNEAGGLVDVSQMAQSQCRKEYESADTRLKQCSKVAEGPPDIQYAQSAQKRIEAGYIRCANLEIEAAPMGNELKETAEQLKEQTGDVPQESEFEKTYGMTEDEFRNLSPEEQLAIEDGSADYAPYQDTAQDPESNSYVEKEMTEEEDFRSLSAADQEAIENGNAGYTPYEDIKPTTAPDTAGKSDAPETINNVAAEKKVDSLIKGSGTTNADAFANNPDSSKVVTAPSSPSPSPATRATPITSSAYPPKCSGWFYRTLWGRSNCVGYTAAVEREQSATANLASSTTTGTSTNSSSGGILGWFKNLFGNNSN